MMTSAIACGVPVGVGWPGGRGVNVAIFGASCTAAVAVPMKTRVKSTVGEGSLVGLLVAVGGGGVSVGSGVEDGSAVLVAVGGGVSVGSGVGLAPSVGVALGSCANVGNGASSVAGWQAAATNSKPMKIKRSAFINFP